MTQTLNIKKHISILDPTSINIPIHIIGCGATGSQVALSLANLGINNVTIWDGDKVESHNIPNQAFSLKHIGSAKVDAMQDIVKDIAPTQVLTWKFINEYYVDQSPLMGIVFLLVDSMSERKIIWENCIKYKPHIKMMLETRLNTFSGRIYTINPNQVTDITLWENNLYEDETADTSACGVVPTMGPTATIIANIAITQAIHWLREGAVGLPPEIWVDLLTMSILKP